MAQTRDKAASHERIVAAASARIRSEGAEHLNVASLMSEAGLTHGGFYRHFPNRDALVEQAVAEALHSGAAALDPEVGLAAAFEAYLSAEHRDAPETGCGLAALCGDVARGSTSSQEQYARQVEANLEHLTAGTGDRADAAVALSAMVGALVMARAGAGSAVSDELLELVRERLTTRYAR